MQLRKFNYYGSIEIDFRYVPYTYRLSTISCFIFYRRSYCSFVVLFLSSFIWTYQVGSSRFLLISLKSMFLDSVKHSEPSFQSYVSKITPLNSCILETVCLNFLFISVSTILNILRQNHISTNSRYFFIWGNCTAIHCSMEYQVLHSTWTEIPFFHTTKYIVSARYHL